MKIIITESQLNRLIAEASKVEILIDKLGFESNGAKYLEVLCGGLSVWVGKKLVKYLGDRSNLNYNSIKDNEDKINSIMKWIKIGLNGNFKQYQDSSFMDLLEMATKWNDSKNIIDREKVIMDFRDLNGLGYYWVNLEKSNCEEEGKRMKHCGKAIQGTLYSLRRTFPTKDAYKSNESVLTAEITPNGELLQLLGVANTDPQPKYYPYIIRLLTHKIDNERYLVTGISPFNDLLDIPELANSEKLLKSRPDLFDVEYKTLYRYFNENERWFDKEGNIYNPDEFYLIASGHPNFHGDFDSFERAYPGVAFKIFGKNARDEWDKRSDKNSKGFVLVSEKVRMKK